MAKVLEDATDWFVKNPPDTQYPYIPIRKGRWTFNGDYERPTFSPSILVYENPRSGRPRTHCFVRDGRIEYLSDSTHALAGQTVDLPEFTEEDDWLASHCRAWEEGRS